MNAYSDLEEQAARWLLRQEESNWSEQDQAELEAWLASSTLHRVTFYRLEFGWRRADRLASFKTAATAHKKSVFPWFRLPHAGVAALAALTVAVLIFLNGGWLASHPGQETIKRTYETEIGSHASYPLADGSQIELNSNSELRTELGPAARTAWLDRGEAYFAIAHNPAVPFTIKAGERTVQVLGTKFSVWRDGSALVVTVVEGRVRVDAPALAPVFATPGDIVTVQGSTALVQHASLDDASRRLDWRTGQLYFDSATLDEVAKQFNRYNRRQIVIDGSAANAVHIGGTFNAENIDAFVRLLQSTYHLGVRNDGDKIVIFAQNRDR